jgi:uncharacterized RDD family membrane protein YckC
MGWGAWGKQWAGMRGVDEARDALGLQLVLGRAVIRYDVFVLTALFPLAGPRSTDRLGVSVWPGLPVLQDYPWMLWNPRKRTVHDKLAGTFVVVS